MTVGEAEGTPFCTDLLGPVMEGLLACADEALTVCGRPAGRVSLQPGNSVAWDDCCEGGGQLWVRLVSDVAQPVGAQPCDLTGNQIRLGLGVVRCAYTVDDEGNPPTPGQMTEDTLKTTMDRTVLLNAIRCCDALKGGPHVNAKSVRIETGLPLGVQGGCVGFEWTLAFNLGYCGTCGG